MRISDWSSDVCSSDLQPGQRNTFGANEINLLRTADEVIAPHEPCKVLREILRECRGHAMDLQPFIGHVHPEDPSVVVLEIARYDAKMDQPEDRKSTRLNSSH